MRGIHMQKMLWPCPGSVKDAVVSQIRPILSQPRVHVSRSLRPQLSRLPCPGAAQPRTEPSTRGDDAFQLSSFTVNRKEKINIKIHPGRQQPRSWLLPSMLFPQILLICGRKEAMFMWNGELSFGRKRGSTSRPGSAVGSVSKSSNA